MQAWVVASELVRGRGKCSSGVAGTTLVASLITAPAFALDNYALPTGGMVSSGNASIGQSGSTLTINQQSQNVAINWQDFNIGSGAAVNFVQPNSSAIALNRVLGTNGTQILGQLNANGQVWILNPNGVLFGNGAQVNVGGLVASTLGMSDADFMAGKRTFTGDGGDVVNHGSINADYVALLGGQVSNEGAIVARMGTVAMGAGSQVTLDFAGDKLLSMQVDQGAVRALAENKGLIQADGGAVIMSAKAKDALIDTVVNNSGIIRARTLEEREGKILLIGDMDSGTVKVGGTLDASAPDGGNGGFIETSAAHVKVTNNAVVTTKAKSGKNGKWLIDPVDFTVAASGGDMTGTALSNALANSDVEIQSTTGGGGVNGDVNIRDTVNWSQNTLTLNAQHDINIFNTMNASGTAGLFFKFNQADAGGNYHVYAPVNLASTGSFRTQSGSAGGVSHWTIITDLGSANDVTGNTGTTLQGIWGDLGGNYVLGADIDASSTAGWNGGLGFTPLGGNNPGPVANPEFSGHFDGLGHVIDGLTINRPTYHHVGLFGHVSNAAISHVGLTNASITGNTSVGGLVGRAGGLSIRNSYVMGAITGTTAIGGMVGADIFPRGSTTLEHVWTAGSVTATAAATGGGTLSGIAGGLIGNNAQSIRYSYSTADVRGGNYVGGLVGSRLWGDIDNSYFAGTIGSNGAAHTDGIVKSAYGMGALAGSFYSSDGIISNSHWNTDTAGMVGIGRNDFNTTVSATTTGLTTAQMRDAANWTGFNFTTTPGSSGWVLMDGVLPLLASEWSSVIHNAHQLQLMGLDLSANYTLANNIDANATNGKDVWLGSSFSPVGSNTSAFTGSFDGQNHTIEGLTIDRTGLNLAGLFGYAGTDSVLVNVKLTNVDVRGQGGVGALVGRSDGRISGSSVVGGTVQGDTSTGGLAGVASDIENSNADVTVSGGSYLGGLVGYAKGSISDSHALGDVSGSGDYVGGLAGYTAVDASVTDSYASGAVSGAKRIGGLVGEAHAAISGSHATGKVTGTSDYVGGLVGATDAAITDSSASGNVIGSNWLGGLVGWSSGTVTDSRASGTVSGMSKIGGLVGEAQGVISGSHATGNVTGTGNAVGGLVGRAVAAIDDSYATGVVSGVTEVGGLVGYGTSSVSSSHAAGAVTGSNNVGGLVGLIEDTGNAYAISNSYATGAVTGVNTGGFTGNITSMGGLVGHNYGAAISLSYATGNVSGSITHGTGNTIVVGGLVGHHNHGGSIAQSYATGTVTANSSSISDLYAGGLAGYNDSHSSITQSYAAGNVNGTNTNLGGAYVGGLVGVNDSGASVSESLATGSVSAVGGSKVLGGLVGGNIYGATVETSFFATTDAANNAINSGLDVVGTGDEATDSSGKTQAELKDIDTFVAEGWDISDVGGDGKVWRIYEGLAGPLLRGFLTAATVSANLSGGKTYDGTVASGTASSYTANVTLDPSLLHGSLTYATNSAHAGTYSTTDGSLVLGSLYSGQQGYDISYSNNNSLTIAKAEATVTANSSATTYNGQTQSVTGYSVSGLVNNEAKNVLTGLTDHGVSGTNAGNYVHAVSGSDTNYNLTFIDGSLDIGKAALSVTTGDTGKTYDGTANASGNAIVATGVLFGSDSINGGTFTYDNKNAGTGKTVTVSDVTVSDGNGGNNYSISYVANTGSSINKASLSVSGITADNKTYDGTTHAVLNTGGAIYTGLIGGDDVELNVVGAFADKNAGTGKTVNLSSGYSGADAGNYLITNQASATADIAKASLTIGTGDVSKTYDGTTVAAGMATATGGTTLFSGDALSGGTFAFTDKNAGTGKTVTVSGVTVNDGNGGNNYDVSYANNTASTINAATATVSAKSSTVIYNGREQSVSGYSVAGLVGGDSAADVLAGMVDTGGIGTKTGSYVHSVTGASASSNYVLSFVDGALTINPVDSSTPFAPGSARYVAAHVSSLSEDRKPKISALDADAPIVAQTNSSECQMRLPSYLMKDCK